jgi:hypothetical protein
MMSANNNNNNDNVNINEGCGYSHRDSGIDNSDHWIGSRNNIRRVAIDDNFRHIIGKFLIYALLY